MWDDSGYELDDPKHRSYFDNAADYADDARKRAREAGIPNPLVKQWEDEQIALAEARGRCYIGGCIMPVGHTGGHFSIAGR